VNENLLVASLIIRVSLFKTVAIPFKNMPVFIGLAGFRK